MASDEHNATLSEMRSLRTDLQGILANLRRFSRATHAAGSACRPAHQALEMHWDPHPQRVFRYGRTPIPDFGVRIEGSPNSQPILLEIGIAEARSGQRLTGILKGETTVQLRDGVATFDKVVLQLAARASLKRTLTLQFVVTQVDHSAHGPRVRELRSKTVIVRNSRAADATKRASDPTRGSKRALEEIGMVISSSNQPAVAEAPRSPALRPTHPPDGPDLLDVAFPVDEHASVPHSFSDAVLASDEPTAEELQLLLDNDPLLASVYSSGAPTPPEYEDAHVTQSMPFAAKRPRTGLSDVLELEPEPDTDADGSLADFVGTNPHPPSPVEQVYRGNSSRRPPSDESTDRSWSGDVDADAEDGEPVWFDAVSGADGDDGTALQAATPTFKAVARVDAGKDGVAPSPVWPPDSWARIAMLAGFAYALALSAVQAVALAQVFVPSPSCRSRRQHTALHHVQQAPRVKAPSAALRLAGTVSS